MLSRESSDGKQRWYALIVGHRLGCTCWAYRTSEEGECKHLPRYAAFLEALEPQKLSRGQHRLWQLTLNDPYRLIIRAGGTVAPRPASARKARLEDLYLEVG